jgi:AraC-like DNA-binding protein
MDVLAPAEADAVSELLGALTVRSSIFCISELRAPWGFSVGGSEVAKFHLVLEGSAWLSVAGDPPLELGAGELVLLLRGGAHTLGDRVGAQAVPLDDLPVDANARLRYGGSGPLTRLICGGFTLADPVLAGLPDVLHVDASATAWLEPVLAALGSDDRPGRLAISTKVADLFLAESLRAWAAGGDGTLADAARDQTVAKAVDAIRTRFAEPWTLERLAAHVGLSRTALTLRFRTFVGDPPMRYLARVRLGHAAGYLATSRLSLYEIARRTGYDNDAAFSKAFKREFGQPPGAYRASARKPPAIAVD